MMMQFYVGLGAIIEREGEILILKRSPEKDFAPEMWEVVTGRLEHGEDPATGIAREIHEETKLEAEVIMPVRTEFFYRGSEEYPMVFIDFWCRYGGGEVEMSWEHTEFQWVSMQDALQNPELKTFHESVSRIVTLKPHLPDKFSFE
ncbi:MAG: NUDIX domain-containing protein [Candidatus Thorarchaeota archaeon]|jgi:8-oxo-dGTP diphosphatase